MFLLVQKPWIHFFLVQCWGHYLKKIRHWGILSLVCIIIEGILEFIWIECNTIEGISRTLLFFNCLIFLEFNFICIFSTEDWIRGCSTTEMYPRSFIFIFRDSFGCQAWPRTCTPPASAFQTAGITKIFLIVPQATNNQIIKDQK